MLETYSWSCSARSMSVHLTGPINWTHQLEERAERCTTATSRRPRASPTATSPAAGMPSRRSTCDGRAEDVPTRVRTRSPSGCAAADENPSTRGRSSRPTADSRPYSSSTTTGRPSRPRFPRPRPRRQVHHHSAVRPRWRIAASDLHRQAPTRTRTSTPSTSTCGRRQVADTGTCSATTARSPSAADRDSALVHHRCVLPPAADQRHHLLLAGQGMWTTPMRPSAFSPPRRRAASCSTPRRRSRPGSPPRSSRTPTASDERLRQRRRGLEVEHEEVRHGGHLPVRALNTDVVRYEYGFNSAPATRSHLNRDGRHRRPPSARPPTNAKPPPPDPNVLYVRAVDERGQRVPAHEVLLLRHPA